MRPVPDNRLRTLILVAPLLMTVPVLPSGPAAVSVEGAVSPDRGTPPEAAKNEFSGKILESSFGIPQGPIPRVIPPSGVTDLAVSVPGYGAADRWNPSEEVDEEDALQAVPFLIASGVILLAVVLVFRGTLRANLRAERSRRSRLGRPRQRPGSGEDESGERPA